MSKPMRIAAMVPENNTTVAAELPSYLGPEASITIHRIPRPKTLLTPETLPPYIDAACSMAADIKGSGTDLVVYACTAASFLQGRAADEAVADRIAEAAGCPVVTTASSMGHRLSLLECQRIALVSPYSDAVNARLTEYLGAYGIAVAALGRLEAPDTAALGRITAGEVETVARRTWDPTFDGLFIACTQLPTLPFIATLDAEWGKPAWSALRSTAWAAALQVGMPFDG